MALCLSVRPSVCPSVRSIKTAEEIDLDYGTKATLRLSCTALYKQEFTYLQNKGTPVWNFVTNSGLRKFRR